MGGRGGGKDDMAQGGGTDVSDPVEAAFAAARRRGPGCGRGVSSTTPGGFRRGIRIGIDVGSVRVGVARTDPDGTPRGARGHAGAAEGGGRTADGPDGLADLVEEYEPLEVVVGLPADPRRPRGPGGRRRPGVRRTTWPRSSRERGCLVPVRLVDERLTTAAATEGCRRPGRDARSSRAVVDQAAAVIIVQHALDAERATGAPPGTLLDPAEDHA